MPICILHTRQAGTDKMQEPKSPQRIQNLLIRSVHVYALHTGLNLHVRLYIIYVNRHTITPTKTDEVCRYRN